jgi:hypothetical protein
MDSPYIAERAVESLVEPYSTEHLSPQLLLAPTEARYIHLLWGDRIWLA